MPPLLSILTPSYNKPQYVMDAVNSVLKQTFTDFEYWLIDNSTDDETRSILRPLEKQDDRIHYLEIDFSKAERNTTYIPAYIFNQVFRDVTTKFGFYISDDDTLEPECFELMIDFMTKRNDAMVSYHTQKKVVWKNNQWIPDGTINATSLRGYQSGQINVDCSLDGGQIMWRNDILKDLPYPYITEELKHASHCDGLFMQQLANKYVFHPVAGERVLSTHRVTPLSTWQKAPLK